VPSPWLRCAVAILGRCLGPVAVAAGAVAAAQFVPATAALGQWAPVRALPGGICRWRGPAGSGIALTFDDGPHPDGTPAVLDRLEALGLRGTFFVVGSQVERWPELVEEVARRGHQVETHGYRHEHHLWRTPRWVMADLRAAVGSLERCGVRPRFYRPSFGQAAGSTLAAARFLGLRTVLWSAWGREWTTTDHRAVATRIVRRLEPGAVVVLHDSDAFGPAGMWRTALRALDAVAAAVDEAGLRAVTLAELLGVPPAPGLPDRPSRPLPSRVAALGRPAANGAAR